MENGTAQPRGMTPGQMKDVSTALVQAVPTDLTFDQAQAFVGRKKQMPALLRKLMLPDNDPNRQLDMWLDMYWLIFRIEPDVFKLALPASRPGFNWLVPCFPEIPTNLVWQAHQDRYSCYSCVGNDPESAVPENDRSYVKGPYGIWVRDRIEADEKLKDLSANVLRDRRVAGITLDERLRLELFYWVRSRGQHLDIENWTLCAGSRDSNGRVPRVRWSGVKLEVAWCGPGHADPALRAREVVSL